ncbi:hypothetical protein Ahy_B04g069108 [Arachis hypogaea]|uniref:Uncharacterized protein n=1 Tax=Arachis hypogaea TaxID=3818 RepID=A0A444ZBR1_ARAHY|nr:hypothetical protein Ahy_B04g069108 [Arachis hypogaea]
MNGIKNAVYINKEYWVELFFGVKVIAMNSHRLPVKGRRMRRIMGHTMHYRPWRYIYSKLLLRAHTMESYTVKSNPIHEII